MVGLIRRIWQHPALWSLGIVGWAVTLWVLSSRSMPGGAPKIPHFDKVAHLAYFTIGSFLFCRLLVLLRSHGSRASLLLATVCFALLVGAADEFHQTFTPGRSGNDAGDLLADTLGGLLGGWLGWRFSRPARDGPRVKGD
jgi:VanZ family protein